MKAKIITQAQYEMSPGYASYVRIEGSKYACASFWATSQAAAIKAAKAYCAQYKLSV